MLSINKTRYHILISHNYKSWVKLQKVAPLPSFCTREEWKVCVIKKSWDKKKNVCVWVNSLKASVQLWYIFKRQNNIVNSLKELEKPNANTTLNAVSEKGLTIVPKTSSTLTPKVSSIYMQQRPGANRWIKKRKRLGIPEQRKLNRNSSKKT